MLHARYAKRQSKLCINAAHTSAGARRDYRTACQECQSVCAKGKAGNVRCLLACTGTSVAACAPPVSAQTLSAAQPLAPPAPASASPPYSPPDPACKSTAHFDLVQLHRQTFQDGKPLSQRAGLLCLLFNGAPSATNTNFSYAFNRHVPARHSVWRAAHRACALQVLVHDKFDLVLKHIVVGLCKVGANSD